MTLTLRSVKGSPLTNNEVDGNFEHLRDTKVDANTQVIASTGLSGGGALTATPGASVSLAIANTGVTANTYGSNTQIPQLIINEQGQITSATTVPLPPSETSGIAYVSTVTVQDTSSTAAYPLADSNSPIAFDGRNFAVTQKLSDSSPDRSRIGLYHIDENGEGISEGFSEFQSDNSFYTSFSATEPTNPDNSFGLGLVLKGAAVYTPDHVYHPGIEEGLRIRRYEHIVEDNTNDFLYYPLNRLTNPPQVGQEWGTGERGIAVHDDDLVAVGGRHTSFGNNLIFVYTSASSDYETPTTYTYNANGFGITSDDDPSRRLDEQNARMIFSADGSKLYIATNDASGSNYSGNYNIRIHNTSGKTNGATYDVVSDADDTLTATNGFGYVRGGVSYVDSDYIIVREHTASGNNHPDVVVLDATTHQEVKRISVPDREYSTGPYEPSLVGMVDTFGEKITIEGDKLFITHPTAYPETADGSPDSDQTHQGLVFVYDTLTWEKIFVISNLGKTSDYGSTVYTPWGRGTFHVTRNTILNRNIAEFTDPNQPFELRRILDTAYTFDLTGKSVATLTGDSVNQKLVFTDSTGSVNDIDLSWAVDDTNLARLTSGSLDSETGIATFTRDDASTFTVNFSALFDDTNNYVDSASFSGGTLTLGRNGTLNDITVSLDGRYLTSYTETSTLSEVTARGAVTTDTVGVGGIEISNPNTSTKGGLDYTSSATNGSNHVITFTGRTAKILVSVYDTRDNSIHATELLVTTDNTDVYITEYATVISGVSLIEGITATVSNFNVSVTIDPDTYGVVRSVILHSH